MFTSEYCDVEYLDDRDVVFVRWKKFCCAEDTEWVADCFMPKPAELGCKCIYLL